MSGSPIWSRRRAGRPSSPTSSTSRAGLDTLETPVHPSIMHRALIVIDMIEDFAHEDGALYCGPSMARVIAVVRSELERARTAREPVLYLTDAHLPDDSRTEEHTSELQSQS